MITDMTLGDRPGVRGVHRQGTGDCTEVSEEGGGSSLRLGLFPCLDSAISRSLPPTPGLRRMPPLEGLASGGSHVGSDAMCRQQGWRALPS
jgi:hypothetical protein